jgi:hypothetical protein
MKSDQYDVDFLISCFNKNWNIIDRNNLFGFRSNRAYGPSNITVFNDFFRSTSFLTSYHDTATVFYPQSIFEKKFIALNNQKIFSFFYLTVVESLNFFQSNYYYSLIQFFFKNLVFKITLFFNSFVKNIVFRKISRLNLISFSSLFYNNKARFNVIRKKKDFNFLFFSGDKDLAYQNNSLKNKNSYFSKKLSRTFKKPLNRMISMF